MQRSLLAFAIATAIVVTAVPVYAGQPATEAARSSALRRTPVRAVLSPVQKELQRNLVLADGLRGGLHGTDPVAAASGFRRLELYVATVHASNTLAIPFFELKRRIVGDGMTLGQAIQDIRPTSRYWIEARRAEDDAAEAIRLSEAVVLAAERKPAR
jgi:hypothetical protein